jgi:hypothetical protein
MAGPDILGSELSQIIALAEQQAANQFQELEKLFSEVCQLGNDVTDLLQEALQRFKDLVNKPNWWSGLVFVMVQISKADPAHLKAGAIQPSDGLAW